MFNKRATLLLSSVAVLAVALTAFTPQIPHATPVLAAQPPQAFDPPGTIDGSKTPDLIPDHIAYTLVFRAIAEPENATEEQIVRARAKIRSIGLNDSESLTIIRLTARFRKAVESLDSQAVAIHKRATHNDGKPSPFGPGSAEEQELRSLSQQKTALALNRIQDLATELSAESVQRMRDFVQRAKAQMKFIP